MWIYPTLPTQFLVVKRVLFYSAPVLYTVKICPNHGQTYLSALMVGFIFELKTTFWVLGRPNAVEISIL